MNGSYTVLLAAIAVAGIGGLTNWGDAASHALALNVRGGSRASASGESADIVSSTAQASVIARAVDLAALNRAPSSNLDDANLAVRHMLTPERVNPQAAGVVPGCNTRTMNCLFVAHATANYFQNGAFSSAIPRQLGINASGDLTIVPLRPGITYPTSAQALRDSANYWKSFRDPAIAAGVNGIRRPSVEDDVRLLGQFLETPVSPSHTALIDGRGARALDNLVGHVRRWPSDYHAVLAINPSGSNRHFMNVAKIGDSVIVINNQLRVPAERIAGWLTGPRIAPHEVTPIGPIDPDVAAAVTRAIADPELRSFVLVQ